MEDTLIALLIRCQQELEKHNRDYHHVTSEAFLGELKSAIEGAALSPAK